MRIFTLLTFRTKKSEHFYFVQTNCKVYRVAQTERDDWHKSTEIGGIVYSETVALLMRRMQVSIEFLFLSFLFIFVSLFLDRVHIIV